MEQIQFASPTSIDEAVGLLADAKGKARVLAGGSDLLVQMRSGLRRPGLIVDIKRIDEVMTIAAEKGGFRVGAAVPCAELVEHEGFSKAWPGVSESADLIGSTQIQGRCSLGGNLCNASPAADTVPALIAAGAVCTVAGPKGRRDVKVEEVCTGPGKTSLADGEMVVSFLFPKRPDRSSDAYLRFIPRTEMDIAVVGVGVSLTTDRGGKITAARVGLGAVAPTVLVVDEGAKALIGSTLDEGVGAKLAAATSAACRPINDKRGTIEYRIKVAGVLARRAAGIAYERARSN